MALPDGSVLAHHASPSQARTSSCCCVGQCLDIQHVQYHLSREWWRTRLSNRHSHIRRIPLGLDRGNRHGYASAYAVMIFFILFGYPPNRIAGQKTIRSHTMYQQPLVGRHVLYQVILFCTSLVVLYPILWVVKIALTPSQVFSMDPWPFLPKFHLKTLKQLLGPARPSKMKQSGSLATSSSILWSYRFSHRLWVSSSHAHLPMQ